MRRIVAPLLFALCAASLARADVGPPAGKKSVPVTTVVEVAGDFPDYAFFEVAYSSSPGPPPHGGTSVSPTFHFVVPGTTLKATGDRRSGGSLYAVPRAVAEQNVHWRGLLKDFEKQAPPKQMSIATSDEAWIQLGQSVKKGEVPGAASIRFGGSDDVPAGDPRAEVTETYRLARAAAGVAFVKVERPAAEGTGERGECGNSPGKCGNDVSSEPIPWSWAIAGAVALAGGLALFVGVAWLAWHLGRRA